MKQYFSFIIRYEDQNWLTNANRLSMVIQIARKTLKKLVKDGLIPVDEIETQVALCKKQVKDIRERQALEKENRKDTIKLAWVRSLNDKERTHS
jgi:hypothetical protein